jgi:hypothetical protein
MTTDTWNVDADGNWASGADWSPTGAPGTGDDVVISTADFHTITHDAGSDVIASLTLGDDALVIDGDSSIEVTATVSNAGQISIGAGSAITAGSAMAVFTNTGVIGTAGAGIASLSLNLTSTGTIMIGAGTLRLDGSANDISGAVTGAGTLDLDAGNTIIRGNTHLVIPMIDLTDTSAKLSFFTNFTYAGMLDIASGTLVLWGGRLKLSGASTIDGAVIGTGTLAQTGGTETFGSGASIAVYRWSLSGVASVAIDEDLSYARKLDLGKGCTLAIAAGDTFSLDDRATISGAVTGPGTLAFTAGEETVNGSARFGMAGWDLSGTADVKLNVSLAYAGSFAETTGAQIQIKGTLKTLTLTGTGVIDGAVNGTGTLALDGATVSFGPGALLYMGQWRLVDGATVTLGTNLTYTRTLVDSVGTAIRIGTGAGLTLYGAVSGGGTISLGSHATLTVSGTVAAGQGIDFSGSDGSLVLTQAKGFAGDIAGFGTGDTIEVANSRFAFGTGETVSYVGSGTGGTLTVKNGGNVLALTLFGQYSAAGFHLASDGDGGTLITYTPPPETASPRLTASPH